MRRFVRPYWEPNTYSGHPKSSSYMKIKEAIEKKGKQDAIKEQEALENLGGLEKNEYRDPDAED